MKKTEWKIFVSVCLLFVHIPSCLFVFLFICLFVCLLLPRRLPWLPSSFPKSWNGNVCDGVKLGQLRRSLRTRQLRPFLLKLGVFHFGSENEKAKLKLFYSSTLGFRWSSVEKDKLWRKICLLPIVMMRGVHKF